MKINIVGRVVPKSSFFSLTSGVFACMTMLTSGIAHADGPSLHAQSTERQEVEQVLDLELTEDYSTYLSSPAKGHLTYAQYRRDEFSRSSKVGFILMAIVSPVLAVVTLSGVIVLLQLLKYEDAYLGAMLGVMTAFTLTGSFTLTTLITGALLYFRNRSRIKKMSPILNSRQKKGVHLDVVFGPSIFGLRGQF